jgi:hypothetical protein
MGWEYPTWSHVNGPAVNLLKGGVLTADRVMTVSKVWQLDGSCDAVFRSMSFHEHQRLSDEHLSRGCDPAFSWHLLTLVALLISIPGQFRQRGAACSTGVSRHVLWTCIPATTRICSSPQGYAWEITTPEGGWGLDGVLQGVQHKLDGIANGIDTTEWSPENDDHLPASYSAADMSGDV